MIIYLYKTIYVYLVIKNPHKLIMILASIYQNVMTVLRILKNQKNV